MNDLFLPINELKKGRKGETGKRKKETYSYFPVTSFLFY